jgi:hypothetical protein
MTCPWLTFTLNGRLILVKLCIELMMENQIEIYTSRDGSTQIEVQFEGDTFWLNLNQISSLLYSVK